MAATVTSVAARGASQTRRLSSLLTGAAQEMVKVEANAWIKRLRLVDYDGRTMRQRFTYRGDSLWWFTEIYLHKSRAFERAIETILALESAVVRDQPARLVVASDDPAARAAARAFSAARRVPLDVQGTEHRGGRRERLLGFAVAPSAWLSRLRPRATSGLHGPVAAAAFVHSAFWHDEIGHSSGGRESYVGPVLDEIARQLGAGRLAAIGLGPRRNFRARRWWDPFVGGPAGRVITPIEQLAPRDALAESLEIWRDRAALAHAIVGGPAIRAAAFWRDYDLWPVLESVLARAADVQWPWSARSMDEARAALSALRPGVAVTYAEAGGWGRALILEARRAGVPSVGLQHGFIYRHWLNYQHEPDEMTPDGAGPGFPRPDTTLVFDGYAVHTLVSRGRFPDAAIEITGSPRLDELAQQVTAVAGRRQALRQSIGATEDSRVLIVAAKHLEIAAELPAIVAAGEALPNVRTIIKPHPAETPDVYRRVVEGSRSAMLAPPGLDLGSLFCLGDALLTMNSTAAIDAMTLGLPAIVVGLPNNLSPFVDAGVMAGASDGQIRAAIEGVLYDRTVRRELVERGRRFVELYGMNADGRAAARTARAVISHAERTAVR